jgi:hypothetical protein
MFRPFGSELAELRTESLRADGGRRLPTSPGPLRRAVGRLFVGARERLLHTRQATCESDLQTEMGGSR